MPQRIVHILEMIEIHEENGDVLDWMVSTRIWRDGFVEQIREQRPVWELG